jgi:enoyl-CoA hydratase/carnithine racemase
MNRPDRLRTLTDGLHEGLLKAIEQAADDDRVAKFVITEPGRTFCVGADLSAGFGGGAGGAGSATTAAGNSRRYTRCGQLLHKMPKPMIAAIYHTCADAGVVVSLHGGPAGRQPRRGLR